MRESVAAERLGGLRTWAAKRAYWVVAAAGVLLALDAVQFTPPERVRGLGGGASAVGESLPTPEFAPELGNPQAVQLRAAVRRFPDPSSSPLEMDPDLERSAQLLSAPVVTTIFGLEAHVDQQVRLESGALELDIAVDATPRLGPRPSRGKAPMLTLDYEIRVRSRRRSGWWKEGWERLELHSRGVAHELEGRAWRLVFDVEGHLFALDLELSRGS